METTSGSNHLNDVLELTAIKERPTVYAISRREPLQPADGEMTEGDWDQFEQDITDAFEQVP